MQFAGCEGCKKPVPVRRQSPFLWSSGSVLAPGFRPGRGCGDLAAVREVSHLLWGALASGDVWR